MRVITIIIGLALGAVGFSAFDFSSKEPKCKEPATKTHQSAIIFPSIKIPQLEKELMYMVGGRYKRSTKEETLKNAKSLSDIISKYPSNWIKEYSSVELLATCNKKQMRAISKNEVLSEEQKSILSSVDIATEIVINVKYKTQNSATNIWEERLLSVSMMLIPEKEAEYVGGYEKMIAFLKENSNEEIESVELDPRNPISIYFTVSENGDVERVTVNKSSGDIEVDEQLIQLVSKMPKWNAAENIEGKKISQEFEFRFGQDGC